MMFSEVEAIALVAVACFVGGYLQHVIRAYARGRRGKARAEQRIITAKRRIWKRWV